jgi:hypothetical protein
VRLMGPASGGYPTSPTTVTSALSEAKVPIPKWRSRPPELLQQLDVGETLGDDGLPTSVVLRERSSPIENQES